MQILIDRFVSQLTDADAALHTAWEGDDLEALAKTSRWIKGSAGTLGFDVFTEPAEELESCIAVGDRNRIPALVAQIHDFVTRVQKGAATADTESDAVA
jgi:HPt (histidine-containing phosphotransfer) domain-containing protein